MSKAELIEVELTGYSYRSITGNGTIKPYLMIAELIDNSIDAGASEVEITIQKSKALNHEYELVVADNGSGMSDFRRFFTPGEHVEDYTKRRIGCFGSGAKVACIWLTHDEKVRGTINIHSVSGGFKYAAHQNIGTIIHDGLKITYSPTPIENPGPISDASHTTILLTGGERIKKISNNRSALSRSLFHLYEPLIVSGQLKIVVNGEEVAGQPAPFVGQPVSFESEIVSGDLVYHVRFECGEVDTTNFSAIPTWNIYHCGRCINYSDGQESFGISLAPRFHGKVFLEQITDLDGEEINQAKWPLSFNKDYLEEWMKEKIGNEIYGNQEVLDLIQRLKESKQTENIRTLQEQVNDILEGIHGTAKGKRTGRAGKEGTIQPAGTGRRHWDAVEKQPAPDGIMKLGGKSKGGTIKVEFLPLGKENPSFLVDSSSKTIQVNTSTAGMAELFSKNHDVNVVRDLVNRFTAVWATTVWAGFNSSDPSFDKGLIETRQRKAALDLAMIAMTPSVPKDKQEVA